jgi:predicted aspartyl protease
MKQLQELLKKEKYKKIKFKVTKTQHLMVRASINGVKGSFILDTGASNSCVGFEGIELFGLKAGKSKTKAAGAGASNMFTQLAKDNSMQIGRWQTHDFHLVIFDLSHVNQTLTPQGQSRARHHRRRCVARRKAIIDYYNHYLYLK